MRKPGAISTFGGGSSPPPVPPPTPQPVEDDVAARRSAQRSLDQLTSSFNGPEQNRLTGSRLGDVKAAEIFEPKLTGAKVMSGVTG